MTWTIGVTTEPATVYNGEGQKPVSQRNVSEILQGKHSKDMKGQFICMNKLRVTDYVLMVGRSQDRFPVVPPTEPCALRSTQPLKVSTRDFSWGKGGWCVWLMTYHPCSAETSR